MIRPVTSRAPLARRICLREPRIVQALRKSTSTSSGPNSSSNTPTYSAPTISPSNRHRDFYKTFGLPMTKVFLGALFTYQVLYWSWLKLESLETRAANEAEIEKLESQAEQLKHRRKVEAERKS